MAGTAGHGWTARSQVQSWAVGLARPSSWPMVRGALGAVSVHRLSPGLPFVLKSCSHGLSDGILIPGVQSPRAISPIFSQADTVPSFVICPVLLGLFRSWAVCFICHFPSLPTPCTPSRGGPVFSQPLHLPPPGQSSGALPMAVPSARTHHGGGTHSERLPATR